MKLRLLFTLIVLLLSVGCARDVSVFESVIYSEDTSLKDSQGETIQLDSLKTNDLIRITLKKPLNISKNNRSFEAKEIRLLE